MPNHLLVFKLPLGLPIAGFLHQVRDLTAVALDLVRKVTLQGVRTEESTRGARLDESSAIPAGYVELAVRWVNEQTRGVWSRTLNSSSRVNNGGYRRSRIGR